VLAMLWATQTGIGYSLRPADARRFTSGCRHVKRAAFA